MSILHSADILAALYYLIFTTTLIGRDEYDSILYGKALTLRGSTELFKVPEKKESRVNIQAQAVLSQNPLPTHTRVVTPY